VMDKPITSSSEWTRNSWTASLESTASRKVARQCPTLAAHIERTVSEPNAQVPLSPDAYARFRRALGELLWMAQVRHDIKIYLSLIGSQQATPMAGTESALRALLRYLHGDMNTLLSIPSEQYMDHSCAYWSEIGVLHAFSDASHAPYRFNQRRSITGGAIFVEGSLIKTVAKQQQSVSLSSCEAELYALQSVSQEAIALAAFCMRVYHGWKRPMMITLDLPLWSRTQKKPSP